MPSTYCSTKSIVVYRTFPVVQGLRLHASTAGAMGSIPGRGTKRERELSYLVVFERVGWVPCNRIPVFLLLLVPIFLIASQGSSWEEITLSFSTEKVFPIVMYRCESWTIKKAEHWRTDAFELCWSRLLRIPWAAKRSNQSILKEINPEYSLEGLMLKLKLQ